MAGEDELNRGGDLGTEADVFCLLENDWEQGDDLAIFNGYLSNISIIFRIKSRLLLSISIHYHFYLNTKHLFTIF
ncbi:hypothetical protein [Anaerobutyricum hallii]|uniref:hypothetical protein n=1 Tax=Anaerobutyricum hallii TaxID=39488 RepID=UPI00242F0F57|nr:hypothetical protein [Anaerobutyricum hallii]